MTRSYSLCIFSLHMCDMAHLSISHASFTCGTWRVPVWHDSFAEWQESFVCLISLSEYVRHDAFICVTWLISMCDMTHLYVTREVPLRQRLHVASRCYSCIDMTLLHTCNMTHPYVRHASFICATWHIHMCDMTHLYVRHDSSICDTRGASSPAVTSCSKT